MNLRRRQIPATVGLLAATSFLLCGCSQGLVQHSAIDTSAQKAVGVTFVAPVRPAHETYISPARAVALAKKSGGPWSGKTASIKAQLGNFSDIYSPGLAAGTPAYLVTFKGRFALGMGRGLVKAKNTERVVVIDARTGHRIEQFSYK